MIGKHARFADLQTPPLEGDAAVPKQYPISRVGATRRNNRQQTAAASRLAAPSGAVIAIPAPDPAPNRSDAPDEPRWRGIAYADRYYYFDTLKFLALHPLSEIDQAFLRRHSKHLDIRLHGKMVFPKGREPYQVNIWPERLRIEIQLPDRAALEFLAKIKGLKLTRADIAIDFTFDDASGKHDMFNYFEKHFTQPYQRKEREQKIFDNGGSDAGLSTGIREKGHYFTGYNSRECRIDGVVDCFHFESRNHGTRRLARLGLHHPKDLLDFNHAGYWQQIESQFLTVDKERLGRFHRNRQKNLNLRAFEQMPYLGRQSKNYAIGAFLYRFYATDEFGNVSVMQFLRTYGRGPFIMRLEQ